MRGDFPESDWRQFKRVHQLLEERFCQRVLDELAGILQAKQGTVFDQYSRVSELIKERNKELANAFHDFRRSTALLQLMIMRRMELLTDRELSFFSEQTQQHIREMDEPRRSRAGREDGPASSDAGEGPQSAS